MPEEEKGAKWWLRYIIVPLIGSGGIAAIIVALINTPWKTQPKPESASIPQASSPASDAPPADQPVHAEPSEGEKSQPTKVPDAGEIDPVTELTVYDPQFSTQYTGRNIIVGWGTELRVRWKFNSSAINGSLLMVTQTSHGTNSSSIGLDDIAGISCPSHTDDAFDETIQFVELHDDNTRRTLAQVHVHCNSNN